jgi:hypothetical protein
MAMNLRISISAAVMLVGSALVIGSASIAANARAANHDASKDCSNASLKGSFGFYRTGSTSAGPLAALGILKFDGKGSVSGSQSISRNGAFQFDIVIAPAPYIVNEDCTGKFVAPDGITEIARIVVTDRGAGLYLFSESAGNAVYGVGRKIGESDEDD